MNPVLIEETPKSLKITADYESVEITKSNFYEFTFTKFDELVWTKGISDLEGKVLFQIQFKKKNAIAGTFLLTMEETHRVGNWLWNIIGINETKEFREINKEIFGKDIDSPDDSGFNFPTHFHRFMKSNFKLSKKEKEKIEAERREEKELGEGYRRVLSGDWSVLIPADKGVMEEILNRFEKTALPAEKVSSIIFQNENAKSLASAIA